MLKLTFYTRTKCPLCDKAKTALIEMRSEYPFELEERDIDESDELTEKYGLMIPVVELDGEMLQYGHIDKFELSKRLQKKD
ncbi:glutaredoxin family protein [Bacillus sp. V33-4]|uniref:glutaredoxin family protein n=1 Tax=Bacillus sp. V33-4 TaxID=2054169 RepID=UPI000C792817|nr:glutaredoxin family protein [Bacillus sp. V33-4]PLR87910.1 NrdH-redoxin [Bacillus sp. V33-4]